MSFSEVSLLIVALIPVLYRGWHGWHEGATTEVRHLLVNLFGILVAIRFWQPVTESIEGDLTFDPRWITIGTFVALYAVSAIVASVVVNLKGPAYRNVTADYLNKCLGVAAGVFSGALLGGCFLWLGIIGDPYGSSPQGAVQSLASVPRKIFRSVEENAADISPGSPSSTNFPRVAMVAVPADAKDDGAPEGAVLMIRRGEIHWR